MKFFPILTVLLVPYMAQAELKLPAIINSNMVLQQKSADLIWGWDTPGTKIRVSFAGQTKETEANADGRWEVRLDPMDANAEPQTMIIEGSNKKQLDNVLVGEVWMCSGQSNMQWSVNATWDAEIVKNTAKHPNLRIINVPVKGTQELQDNFEGQWQPVTPENIGSYSAVGYAFGRVLHQSLDVPVGLIHNSWGGSSAEAWIRRDVIDNEPKFAKLAENWKNTEATYDYEKVLAAHNENLKKWEAAVQTAKAENKPAPRKPNHPQNSLTGQHRPGNIYAGMLHSHIRYGIKGVIWYQGESNAGRAYEYRELFPYLINFWRKEAQQGDISFYWAQLANFMKREDTPGNSNWAELREAQTLTQKLPNTGQAVIIDIGEANDIHPRNKRDVGERLARIALAKDYGVKINYRSPEFKSAEFKDGKAILQIDTFGSQLRTVDVDELKGFAIAGADRQWKWATATLISGNQIQVSHPDIKEPQAVRYAWANNPAVNVISHEGLPLTPFRTDNDPLTTAPQP